MKRKTNNKSWWRQNSNKMSVFRSICWILASVVIVSGSSAVGLLFYQHSKKQKQEDEKYSIVALVQASAEREQLKNVYIAELLDLSIDKAQNLYKFSIVEAQKKLEKCSLFKQVNLKKISPGTVFVNYVIRQPVAFIGDFTNTAIDREGVLIPFKPFFSPKKLPTIIFGKDSYSEMDTGQLWGNRISTEKTSLAYSLIKQFREKDEYSVSSIDLSRIDSESFGKREIIVKVDSHCLGSTFIRLNSRNNQDSFSKLYEITNVLKGKILVLDLRIDNLALISN